MSDRIHQAAEAGGLCEGEPGHGLRCLFSLAICSGTV